MSSQEPRVNEVRAMSIAQPILEKIYGKYQLAMADKPDARIYMETGESVGIEIMCLDSEEYLKYTNTELNKVKKKLSQNTDSHEYESIGLTRVRLYPSNTGLIITNKKNKKYDLYLDNEFNFHEMILLIHTNLISNHAEFPLDSYLYVLEKSFRGNGLSFDRVLLVNLQSSFCHEVFRKNKKILKKPNDFNYLDWQYGRHYIDQEMGHIKFGTEGGVLSIDCSSTDIKKNVRS